MRFFLYLSLLLALLHIKIRLAIAKLYFRFLNITFNDEPSILLCLHRAPLKLRLLSSINSQLINLTIVCVFSLVK